MDEVDKHRGDEPGALAGQSVLRTVADSLRNIAQYSASSGTITTLTDLGLTFDDDGHLSFDNTTFASADAGALFDFLGSTTGAGFLKSATGLLGSLQDSTGGAVAIALDSIGDLAAAQADLIAAEQERVALYEEALLKQMAAADALVAALEQTALYMNGLFESMRVAAQAYA
jgi:flagellar hook-associated protein 2